MPVADFLTWLDAPRASMRRRTPAP
jgi:hypothetical protein